jgi:5-methylcytosine-specific restriction endonuclease McrA
MKDDPRYLKNREKRIQQVKAWAAQNGDRIRANKRKHARRRAFWKLVHGTNWRFEDKLTPFDLWKVAHRQKLVCALTGEKLTRDTISVDHIIPRSKGGKNVPSNIRLTTRDVNWFRRTMTDDELLKMCRRVVNHMEKR